MTDSNTTTGFDVRQASGGGGAHFSVTLTARQSLRDVTVRGSYHAPTQLVLVDGSSEKVGLSAQTEIYRHRQTNRETQTDRHRETQTHTYRQTDTSTYARTHARTHSRTHARTHTHTHTHIHTHTHTHIHTHTHTYTHTHARTHFARTRKLLNLRKQFW